MASKKDLRRLRIRRGIKSKISGTAERPRLSVFKSNKGIYAQLIDDVTRTTISSSSSREIEKGKLNVEISKAVGKALAEKATANGLNSCVFDRSGYLYHGVVKALADGAREGGLKF